MTKRVWIALPDQLSIRMFIGTGIVDGLRARLDDRLAAVLLVRPKEAAEWAPRLGEVPVLLGDELTAGGGGPERVLRIRSTSSPP